MVEERAPGDPSFLVSAQHQHVMQLQTALLLLRSFSYVAVAAAAAVPAGRSPWPGVTRLC